MDISVISIGHRKFNWPGFENAGKYIEETLRNSIAKQPGLTSVDVDTKAGEATVKFSYDENNVKWEQTRGKINKSLRRIAKKYACKSHEIPEHLNTRV